MMSGLVKVGPHGGLQFKSDRVFSANRNCNETCNGPALKSINKRQC